MVGAVGIEPMTSPVKGTLSQSGGRELGSNNNFHFAF